LDFAAPDVASLHSPHHFADSCAQKHAVKLSVAGCFMQGQAHGNATVLKCLVKSYNKLAEGCQHEMSRMVRMALWEYKKVRHTPLSNDFLLQLWAVKRPMVPNVCLLTRKCQQNGEGQDVSLQISPRHGLEMRRDICGEMHRELP
jgi:hypothetical protein